MKKRFTEEQIVKILGEATAGIPIKDLCRQHGISEQSFFRWRNKYAGLGSSELKRLRELEHDNSRLMRLLATRDLEIDAMREVLKKNW